MASLRALIGDLSGFASHRIHHHKACKWRCPLTHSNQNQLDRFREAARELECDDDEARFDAALKKIAKPPKPKDEKPAEPK